MKKVIILKGLPASGKSTFAKQLIADNPGVYKRVNKDDLRAMIDGGKWSSDNEKLILKIRDNLILQFLENGNHIIVDDTNLHPKHIQQIKQLVKGKAEVEEKFFEITIEEAVKRDLKRFASVGESVIKKMYNDFLIPEPEKIIDSDSLPYCAIVDIDGTIADKKNRSPFDWNKVYEDAPKVKIIHMVEALHKSGNKIIFFSGRDSVCRELTEEWIDSNTQISDYELYMRPNEDRRKDSVVKRELFDKYIRGKYNIRLVIDDRDQVVSMWRRELGLQCMQVEYGDF